MHTMMSRISSWGGSSLRSFPESFLRASTILLAALLPLFFLPSAALPPTHAKFFLLFAYVFFAGIAWLVHVGVERVVRFPKEPLFYLALALPLVYALSGVMTGWTAASFVGTGTEPDTIAAMILLYGLFALSSLALLSPAVRERSFARALLFSGAAVLLFQFFRVLFPSAALLSLGGAFPAISSNFIGSWHDIGLLSGVICFLGIVLGVRESGAARALAFLSAALGFLMLLLANFSDVWLSVGVLSAAYGAYVLLRARIRRISGWIGALFIGIALVLIAGSFASDALLRLVPERLSVPSLEVRPSWEGTFTIGNRSLEEGSLLFGSGPNSFAREWNRYKTPDVNTTAFWDVSFARGIGVIPTSVVTLGLLGFLGWLAVLLGVVWLGRGFLRPAQLPASSLFPPLFFLAVFLVAAHVFSAPSITISALTFLVLGALVAWKSRERADGLFACTLRSRSFSGIAGSIVLVLLSCCVLFATTALLRAAVSNAFVNAAVVRYQKSGDIGAAERTLARALALYPENDRAHRAAIGLGLLTLSTLAQDSELDSAETEALRANIATAVEHGLSAVSIDANEYQNWLSLAFLYQSLAGVGVEGALEQAQRAYEAAEKENPTSPLPPFRLAQLAVGEGDSERALAQLKKSVELKPDFAPAYYLEAQVLAGEGQFTEAIAPAATVAQIAPEEPAAWFMLGAVLYSAGSLEDASQALEVAVRLQSDYSNALYLLALSYQGLGRTDEALPLLRMVAQLNPENEDVRKAIEGAASATTGAQ